MMEQVMVRVRLAQGTESGLANILAQLLRQNLDDSERKSRAASRLRGRLAMIASDRGYKVTLVFDSYGVTIADGEEGPIDARIAGPYEALLKIAQGKSNPLLEHVRGRLKVGSRLRRPFLPLRVHSLMRVDEKEDAGAAGRFRSADVIALAAILGGALSMAAAAWLLVGVL